MLCGMTETGHAATDGPALLTSTAAAQALGISTRLLRQLREAGRIGFIPVGDGPRPRVYYTRQHLEEFLRSSSTTSTPRRRRRR